MKDHDAKPRQPVGHRLELERLFHHVQPRRFERALHFAGNLPLPRRPGEPGAGDGLREAERARRIEAGH